MADKSFVSPDVIRAAFSHALSDMYRQEVPKYGALLELVADINAGDDLSVAGIPVRATAFRPVLGESRCR